MIRFIFGCVFLIVSLANAETLLPQSPDLNTLKQISEHNFQQSINDLHRLNDRNQEKVVPFAEYQKTGYVFFNDDDYSGYAHEIKRTIAEHLPQDVQLVVYTTSRNQSYIDSIRRDFNQYIDSDRLIVLKVPRSGSNSFWTRDNLPLPVWTDDQFTLVDARYYYNFEPDDFIIDLYQSLSSAHNYFFEGGNFTANAKGDCIVVNRRRSYPGGVSDTGAIPDQIFTKHYGCKRLTRLKHLKGIGHSDEVVKFMSDNVVVTDTRRYVKILEDLGYQVHMLPEPDRSYETYVNSLQVNNVLFVPSFGESGDQKAVDIYKSINPNLKVVSIPTRLLATRGQGGIHCITMNYPPAPMKNLFRLMGAEVQ